MQEENNRYDIVSCETCRFCVWDTFREIFICNQRDSDWFREEVFTTDHCGLWEINNDAFR